MFSNMLVATDLSADADRATVLIKPGGPCPESHAGCPVRALAEGGALLTAARNVIHAGSGDRVVVEMESPRYYKALFLAFGLPLAAMVAGYLAGSVIGRSFWGVGEAPGAIGAVAGACASLVAMRFAGRNCAPRYTITGWANGDAPVHEGVWQG